MDTNHKMAIVLSLLAICSNSFSKSAIIEKPDNTKKTPIKRVSFFPNNEQIEKGYILKNPCPICIGYDNTLYIGDVNYCVVYNYDKNGEYIKSFGKKGQGPEEYGAVHHLAAFKGGLALEDGENMRISIIDNKGKQTNSFKIFKSYSDIAISEDEKILVSPRRENHLIEILDNKGQIIGSLGEKLKFKNKHVALNEVFIQANSKGDIYVAWKYFPIVKKYSQRGGFEAEYDIGDQGIRELIKKNKSASDSVMKSNRISLMGIINCFFLSDNYFYVFLYGNDRARIVEYDYRGEKTAIYEIIDDLEKVIYISMGVIEKGYERTFYVVQAFPEAQVDIYKESH